jgi:dihydroorotate dehydrogenase
LDIYQAGIRPLLFSGLKADPEMLHHQLMRGMIWLQETGDRPPSQWVQERLRRSLCVNHPALQQSLWGITFPNPVGLAAGFDKNGEAADAWECCGFGYVELGTVTYHGQPGNPRPRMFRLLEDQAALNRMGFNNEGAAAMAKRLADRAQPKSTANALPFPIGINLGKSKITPLEAAASDYLASFRVLKSLGDYFVVNVSSPNTPGLRSLQSSENLDRILATLQQENAGEKPLLVKIAPDLEWEAIADILTLAQTHNLAGIIATNTTIRRDQLKTQILPATGKPITEEAGGISGAPLRQRSTDIIRFIYQKTNGTLPIIGVGGIFTADDAWEKITAGASLLQLYTGWIYEGPWMLHRLLTGLIAHLETHGFKHLQDAVGIHANPE